ncbi:MAG: LysE family transporter [Akkermansia sp.]
MPDIFYSFLLFTLLNQFTPGPNNLMAMAHASKFGLKRTIRFSIGVSLANMFLLILGCLLQHFLHQMIPGLTPWMNSAIALYMGYLAWQMVSSKLDAENAGDVEGRDYLNSIKTGFFLQFINPKLILFALAVSGAFLLPLSAGNDFLLGAYITLLGGTAFLANNMWSLFGALIHQCLSRWRQLVNWVMALLILWCGIDFLLQ